MVLTDVVRKWLAMTMIIRFLPRTPQYVNIPDLDLEGEVCRFSRQEDPDTNEDIVRT